MIRRSTVKTSMQVSRPLHFRILIDVLKALRLVTAMVRSSLVKSTNLQVMVDHLLGCYDNLVSQNLKILLGKLNVQPLILVCFNLMILSTNVIANQTTIKLQTLIF